MTRDEVIRAYCEIHAAVYYAIDNYDYPEDGFCSECPHADKPESFMHTGNVINFIREAVVGSLKANGFTHQLEDFEWEHQP